MKILRNITNISSGASFPLISHLHTDSLHSDTLFLIQTQPPHHFTSPQNPPQTSTVDAAGNVVCVIAVLCVCVCVCRGLAEK